MESVNACGKGEKGCRGKQAPFVDRDNRRQLSSSSSSFLRCPHIQERPPPSYLYPRRSLQGQHLLSLSLCLAKQLCLPPPAISPPSSTALPETRKARRNGRRMCWERKRCLFAPLLPHFSSAQFPFPVCLPAAHAFVRFDGVVAGKREVGGWGEQGQDLYLSLRCM